MPHPMESKIADLRRRARRLLALYGLGWMATSMLAALLVLGLLDYLIHFQDRGIRTIASLTVLGVTVWSGYRFFYQAMARRLRDVDIAKRVERRFPVLRDRLSSSIEFLGQNESDPQAGSAALRRAVITQTMIEVEQLDLSQVLERQPTRRALISAGALSLFVLLIVALDPLSSRVAIARLANPFGNAEWPRFHNLAFRNPPSRIPSGQTFEVELVDLKNRLPDEVRVFFRYEGDRQQTDEVEVMHPVGGMLVARKENVTRPFLYRAEGGDDQSMDWIRLEVVEPPRVESLKLKLHPPEYTGWPVEESDKHIQALRGTRVEVVGTSTKPLSSATLRQENGAAVPVERSADGHGFSISAAAKEPFVVDQSGAYWLDLQDVEGIAGGQDSRWEIRAVADEAPTVTIEQPGSDIFVTAEAVVPLRIVARDDLAIRHVELNFSRSDKTEVEKFPVTVWTGPERVEPTKTTGLLMSGQLGDRRVVEHRWELAPLQLKPGTQVVFRCAAGDYLPQSGESPARRLTIITREELEDRIAQRQANILNELNRALKMQQETRGQTTALEIQMREVGHLNKQDIDHAQGAELNQRQVTRTLASETEGVPAQVADLLADLENNKVDQPDIQRRMTGILEEIERLKGEHLTVIERELTSAIKGAQAELPRVGENQPKSPAEERLSESLTSAGQHQDQVIASLEAMVGELSEWDNYRRFAREIADVRRDQEEIQRQTKELGLGSAAKEEENSEPAGKPGTLGKDWKDLEPQQQADLKKLATRGQELARRFDKIQQKMNDAMQQLEKNDPLAAQTIADALHQARERAISSQMRQSSGHVDKNQIGQAVEKQDRTAEDLEEMLNILSNRSENELSRLIKRLRQAEEQLAELRKKQEGLRKKIAEAAAQQDEQQRKQELERLAREQKQLQDEAERFARQLQRLQAERASQSASSGAAKMGQASAAGQQGDAAGAEKQAAGSQQDLDQAQQELAERRRQAEADLAREQLARMEDALKSLHERQQQVLAETERLAQAQAEAGQLGRPQMESLVNLAREERAVQSETRSLADKLAAAEVFHLALDGASKDLARATDLLERRDTGEDTQKAEQDALARFAQVLEALKPGEAQPNPGQSGGQGGGGGQSQQDAIRALAEVKLLKLMQESLNARYRSLAEATDQSPEQQAEEFARLAEEQGRLAEMTQRLSSQAAENANAQERPEEFPELELDRLLEDNLSPEGEKEPQ